MANKKPKFWHNFEKFVGDRYPKFINEILFKAGFDNKLSLKLIDEKTIGDLEKFIEKNRYLLKNTSYEKNTQENINPSIDHFKFSLGHRLLITSIPEHLKKFDEENDKIYKRKESKTQNDLDTSTLKSNLLKKLKNYSKTSKFNFFLTENNIQFCEI